MTITNGYATQAEVKAALDVTSTDSTDDGFLDDCVTAASRTIDNLTGRTFYARTETHYYDVPSSRELEINDDDLLTVTTLKNGDGSTISSANYVLSPRNTSPKTLVRLLPSSSEGWTSDANGETQEVIEVAGTWGYASSAPADIKQACIEIAVSAYKRRFGEGQTSDAAQVTAVGVVITPGAVPASARLVINRYKRHI